MADTIINMFGGSPLNRLAWLRTSHQFLNAAVVLPSARWLLFNDGQPLVANISDANPRPSPTFLTTEDVKPFLGTAPYFGQAKEPGELVSEEGKGEHSPTQAARHLGLPIVFLGLHERKIGGEGAALPSEEFKDPDAAIAKIDGTLYFSMDVADLDWENAKVQEVLDTSEEARKGKALSWSEPRVFMSGLDKFTAAVFAQGKSLVDWNHRNKFCPACGTRAYSLWGGWKIGCSTLLPWTDNTSRKPCLTVKGLHNFTHPRTDPVVIMVAIDETGDRVLLGRGKRFPGKFYSALAGFIEPGESFEDAVAREMWEEAGVTVWNIKYHSGQPWPYPANLMVGYYVRADSSQTIRTDLDNELVDAKWFSRDEVIAVLEHRAGTKFTRADHKKITDNIDNRDNKTSEMASQAFSPDAKLVDEKVQENPDEPPFRLPPDTAIAGVLIRDWAYGKIGFPVGQEQAVAKGNL